MGEKITVETNQEYLDLLNQLAFQNDLLNQQITASNEYLTTIVTVAFYLSMLISFMAAYFLTKGQR